MPSAAAVFNRHVWHKLAKNTDLVTLTFDLWTRYVISPMIFDFPETFVKFTCFVVKLQLVRNVFPPRALTFDLLTPELVTRSISSWHRPTKSWDWSVLEAHNSSSEFNAQPDKAQVILDALHHLWLHLQIFIVASPSQLANVTMMWSSRIWTLVTSARVCRSKYSSTYWWFWASGKPRTRTLHVCSTFWIAIIFPLNGRLTTSLLNAS